MSGKQAANLDWLVIATSAPDVAKGKGRMLWYGLTLVEQFKAELRLLQADKQGITSLEYAILAMTMLTALVASFPLLMNDLNTLFNAIAALLPAS